MHLLSGPIFTPEGFVEGVIGLDDLGIVREVTWGARAPPGTLRGVIVPRFVNAHTHVGDRLLRGRIPPGLSLEELVKPPNGFKHRALREATHAQIVAGIRDALHEMAATGTRGCLDFREMGLAGLNEMQEAGLSTQGVLPQAYARTSQQAYDPVEVNALFAHGATGIGLSSISDVPYRVAEALSAHAKQAGRRFALHASEGTREDFEKVLALEPDFVVHMVHATKADLRACAERHLPIVLCPRSNARLSRLPDVARMLAEGVPLALGTDNAMLQDANLLNEMRFLHEAMPSLPKEAILRMATYGGAALFTGYAENAFPAVKARADLAVFPEHPGAASPADSLFAPGAAPVLVLAQGRPLT